MINWAKTRFSLRHLILSSQIYIFVSTFKLIHRHSIFLLDSINTLFFKSNHLICFAFIFSWIRTTTHHQLCVEHLHPINILLSSLSLSLSLSLSRSLALSLSRSLALSLSRSLSLSLSLSLFVFKSVLSTLAVFYSIHQPQFEQSSSLLLIFALSFASALKPRKMTEIAALRTRHSHVTFLCSCMVCSCLHYSNSICLILSSSWELLSSLLFNKSRVLLNSNEKVLKNRFHFLLISKFGLMVGIYSYYD